MHIVVVLGFILFIIILSGNWSKIRSIVFILAIPILLWISLRVAMLVGVAFRSGIIGGLILAGILFYLIKRKL